MEKGLTRKKVEKFGKPEFKLLNTPKDFFILSLSISTGLLFFTIFLYIIIKISSFTFGSSSSSSFEGDGQSLDSLDDLLQDEEVVDEEKEAIKEGEKGEENPPEEDEKKTV